MTTYYKVVRPDGTDFYKECAHCGGDGFEPMTGKFKESHVCFVCGGEGEVVSNETGATTDVRIHPDDPDIREGLIA